jgi:hypothetical protein
MPASVGTSGNPYGRPPGSRNKRTEDVWKALEARGDKDPLDFLSALITNEATEAGLRVAAANYILPYKHSKRGPTPAPRYVDDPITVPDFVNVQDAQNFLADIARRSGAGELELQSALDISTLVKNWILSVTAQDEFQLKVQTQGGATDTTIRIEGGLPSLPGTNINMAKEPTLQMNGHNGQVIEHEPVTESIPQTPSEGQG